MSGHKNLNHLVLEIQEASCFFSSSACSLEPSIFLQAQLFTNMPPPPVPLESTKSYSTGFRVCGQALDSIISQTAGWQPTGPSLTWLPPWPLPNVINISNQWRKQGGSGRGREHDLLVSFKRPVVLCLHLILTLLFRWSKLSQRWREVS